MDEIETRSLEAIRDYRVDAEERDEEVNDFVDFIQDTVSRTEITTNGSARLLLLNNLTLLPPPHPSHSAGLLWSQQCY